MGLRFTRDRLHYQILLDQYLYALEILDGFRLSHSVPVVISVDPKETWDADANNGDCLTS